MWSLRDSLAQVLTISFLLLNFWENLKLKWWHFLIALCHRTYCDVFLFLLWTTYKLFAKTILLRPYSYGPSARHLMIFCTSDRYITNLFRLEPCINGSNELKKINEYFYLLVFLITLKFKCNFKKKFKKEGFLKNRRRRKTGKVKLFWGGRR